MLCFFVQQIRTPASPAILLNCSDDYTLFVVTIQHSTKQAGNCSFSITKGRLFYTLQTKKKESPKKGTPVTSLHAPG